jgi:SHS2 domain-containing protein
MAAAWEHFEHEADVGVRGIGATPAQAFEQAALAMTAVITDPATVTLRERVEIRCENDDLELLLADWLNALVFEMATRHLLFGEFAVKLEGATLTGVARGERVDVHRHRPAVEVKGATLTELKVARRADGNWIAQCVVDV